MAVICLVSAALFPLQRKQGKSLPLARAKDAHRVEYLRESNVFANTLTFFSASPPPDFPPKKPRMRLGITGGLPPPPLALRTSLVTSHPLASTIVPSRRTFTFFISRSATAPASPVPRTPARILRLAIPAIPPWLPALLPSTGCLSLSWPLPPPPPPNAGRALSGSADFAPPPAPPPARVAGRVDAVETREEEAEETEGGRLTTSRWLPEPPLDPTLPPIRVGIACATLTAAATAAAGGSPAAVAAAAAAAGEACSESGVVRGEAEAAFALDVREGFSGGAGAGGFMSRMSIVSRISASCIPRTRRCQRIALAFGQGLGAGQRGSRGEARRSP